MPNATRTTAAPRISINHVTQSFAQLATTVRDAGLLGRSYWFYASYASALVLALAGIVAGVVLIGDSWWQLVMAVGLGIVLTHFAFLGHESSHRAIFRSARANDTTGKVLSAAVVGVSYQWWVTKHSKHHSDPNTIGKDPDISMEALLFVEEDVDRTSGLRRWLHARQGWLFFPLLLLEGGNLHRESVLSLLFRDQRRERWLELSGIVLRFAVYFTLIALAMPFVIGVAFVLVQLAVFGLYMGASFAPNHKGMAIIEEGARVDFLSRQVLTSRNITGGWWMSIFMGGLNYQVEHHLFPNMARTKLARTRAIVQEHCEAIGLAYTETTLLRSYAIIVAYLNRVGLGSRDPFDCPERVAMGR